MGWCEAAVNHVSGHKGGVPGVYNRAVFGPEKARAMQVWGGPTPRRNATRGRGPLKAQQDVWAANGALCGRGTG
jgi:hypothetical protein